MVIPVEAKQATFLRQLQLGWRYEVQYEWEKAQEAYAQAALASQDEIAREARNGILRISRHQQGFWPQLQQTIRAMAPYWVTLFIILGLWFFFTWPAIKTGYVLLPFDDYTEKKIGIGLHSLIHFSIQEARHVHDLGHTQLLGFATTEFPIFATLSATNDEFSDLLSSLETLSIGGVEVPFGKLLATIRQWLNRRQYTISGQVHQQGDKLYLSAAIRDTNTHQITAGWELSGDSTAKLAPIIKELAYRILFHIGNTPQHRFEANSWRSLMLFTEGLHLIQADTRSDVHGNLTQAQILFQEVVKIDPGYSMAQYVLGINQIWLGDYERARHQFDEIIEMGENLQAEATYNLGLTFYHEFRPWAYEKAKSCFQKTIHITEKSEQPDQVLLCALAFTGIANTVAQMIGEESVLEKFPKESLMAEVEENCQKASQLIANRDRDSQTRFVQALVYNARGIAAYYADNFSETTMQMKKTLRNQPDNLVAYGYLALAALKRHDEVRALAWFERTLEWNAPRYIEYFYYKFGRYFQLNEDWDHAIDYYSQAPNHPFAVNYMGGVYAQTGDFAGALAMFRKASQLNSKIPEFWLNLAYYITKMDDVTLLPEALEAANRAISLQDNWRSRDVLGWVYYRQGNFPEAERQLYNSIKLDDQRVQNHYHLACVFWKQANANKALELIAKAFATSDKNPKWRKRTAELRTQIQAKLSSQS